MNIIQTKSLELAVVTEGNPDSRKLAILIPGRLDTKDYINFVSHAHYLAGRGFFVVAFDPPGIWDSPGAINLYTTTNYLKAIDELIEYFGNKPTILVGHSRGAAAAILASVKNNHIVGIVPIMPNLGSPTSPSEEDLKRGFARSLRDMPPGSSKTSEQKEFNLPITYWTDGQKYNPTEALKKCIVPKLLIYGNTDEFTSVEAVKELFNMITEPKMIKEVNSEHDYRYHSEVIKEVEVAIGQFLDRFFIDIP